MSVKCTSHMRAHPQASRNTRTHVVSISWRLVMQEWRHVTLRFGVYSLCVLVEDREREVIMTCVMRSGNLNPRSTCGRIMLTECTQKRASNKITNVQQQQQEQQAPEMILNSLTRINKFSHNNVAVESGQSLPCVLCVSCASSVRTYSTERVHVVQNVRA